MTYFPILDISRYQAPVNPAVMWQQGVRLIYLRCTVGNYYTDLEFANYWDIFKDAGFLVGVYHVNTPEYSVSSQMDRLFGPDGLNGRIPDVPIVLDCELTRGQSKFTITANILDSLEAIEDLDERIPMVYTRATWWNPNVNPSPLFAKHPLFIARYTTYYQHPWNDNPIAFKPHSFNEWALWQFSADGNGQGVAYGCASNSVDLDRGNADTLEGVLELIGASLPPVEPPPGEDPVMKFKAKNNMNVRSGPNTTYPIVASLPAQAVITAQEIQPTDANSVWVKYASGKWVAMVHNGGGPYLDFVQA